MSDLLFTPGQFGKKLLKTGIEIGSKKMINQIFDSATKSTSKKRKRVSTRSVMRPDGTSTGTRRVSRQRKRPKQKPKSLKKRIQLLEKNKPKVSIKNWASNEFFKVPQTTAAANSGRMFQIQCVTAGFIDGALTSLSGNAAVDFTADNTAVQIKNNYSKVLMKNSQLGNIKLKYMFVKCNDNTNTGYQGIYGAAYQDRYGSALGGTLSPVANATATTSIYPERRILSYPESQAGLGLGFTYLEAKDWSKVGPIYNIILGPGDSVVAAHAEKMSTYRPEDRDVAGTTYLKGDICLIAFMEGTLSHDATNHDKVGLGLHALDIERSLRFQVAYSDGKGLRQHTITAAVSTEGFTSPSHADNLAGAIETDNE